MQWLNELPFADNRVLQIGFLAACGIAALIVLAIVYRLAFAHRLRVPGGRTRQPRLGLVDAFSLDGQRQLVLIRRDNIEHLVMIGGPNDVLVESQINRAAVPARESTQASPLLVPSTPVRQAPLPASAAAEAPAKVAAKAQASAPTPALPGPITAAPAAPAVVAPLAPIPAPAPLTPPAAPPPVPKAPAPASRPSIPARSHPSGRARTGAAAVRCARDDASRRSPPDLRRRVRRRVRRSRVRHSRVRRCLRRSFPPTPRRIAGPRPALRKQRSRKARARPRPPLPSRLCSRAGRRERKRQSLARKPTKCHNGENRAACGVNRDSLPAGQRGLVPSAAHAEDALVCAGV